jgi:hypothetical protein
MASVAVIVAGWLLFIGDGIYGPKDEILYLWPIPVVLLMAVAACILLYQVGAFIFRQYGVPPEGRLRAPRNDPN